MSKVVNAAVEKLNEKIGSFGSTAKFVIEDEGAIMICLLYTSPSPRD